MTNKKTVKQKNNVIPTEHQRSDEESLVLKVYKMKSEKWFFPIQNANSFTLNFAVRKKLKVESEKILK